MEFAKYVNCPLVVSIIGSEQRGPDAEGILASILSEKPVPSHFGDENASSLSTPASVLSACGFRGTEIGSLITRDAAGLGAGCFSAVIETSTASYASAELGSATAEADSPPLSGCMLWSSVSSDLRCTVVPFLICFGGLFRAFFLLFLPGEEVLRFDGTSLWTGDPGLCMEDGQVVSVLLLL